MVIERFFFRTIAVTEVPVLTIVEDKDRPYVCKNA